MKKALLFLLSIVSLSLSADELKASFSSDKSMTAYYTQGFDTEEDFSSWEYSATNRDYTWFQSVGMGTDVSFTSINPASTNSLAIEYDETNPQKETATSPVIEIKPGSSVEFYNYFSPVWLFAACWTFSIIDVEKSDTIELLNQFRWANNAAYDETKWTKFSFDLKEYTGKKVRFSFCYKGTGGDSQLIDGFKVVQIDDSEDAKININQGDSIEFVDRSVGEVKTWQWEFEGGTPSVSTDKNPVVKYNEDGVYSVKLTVGDGTSTSTVTRKDYITVRAEQPNAIIGVPEEGYLSPFVATIVPTNVPVQFHDLSTGSPTSWEWTFKGVEPETSNEQNPVVTYKDKGIYSLSLVAKNSAGTDTDALLNAIQAGGAQYVWNISPEEIETMGEVSLSWYGKYAGSNWLGMTAFAEHFQKPLAPATIDSVDVYYYSNKTISPDAIITVSIRKPDASGAPGEILTSATIKAGDIAYDDENLVPTIFKFVKPAEITDEFFVVVDGMPNAMQEEPYYESDDISIICVRRAYGEKSTTWHLLENQDNDGNPTGGSTWFENIDDPVSMAVCPVITYDKPDTPTSIINIMQSTIGDDDAVYTLQGVRVKTPSKKGIYIKNGKKYVVK